jgi:hypothetical protein
MPLKKQPFGLVPIPKKFTYPNPLKKTFFGKGWDYPILPSSPKKNPFEKKKERKFIMIFIIKSSSKLC